MKKVLLVLLFILSIGKVNANIIQCIDSDFFLKIEVNGKTLVISERVGINNEEEIISHDYFKIDRILTNLDGSELLLEVKESRESGIARYFYKEGTMTIIVNDDDGNGWRGGLISESCQMFS